jgi:hypothetical protein
MVKLAWGTGNILISAYEPLSILYDTENEKLRFKITAIRQRDGATVQLLDDTRYPYTTRTGQGEIIWDWGPYPPFNPSPLGDPPTDRWDIWDVKIEVFDENNNKKYEYDHYILHTAMKITNVQYFDEKNRKLEGLGAYMLIVVINNVEYRFVRKQIIGATQVANMPTYIYSFQFPYPVVGTVKKTFIEFYSEKNGFKYYIIGKTTEIIKQYTGTEPVRIMLFPRSEIIVSIEVEINKDVISEADRRCRMVYVGHGETERICFSDLVKDKSGNLDPNEVEKIKSLIISELNDMIGLKWTYIGARRIDTYVWRFYFVADPVIPVAWILIAIIVGIIAAGWVATTYFNSVRDIRVAEMNYKIIEAYKQIYLEYLNAKNKIIDICKKLYTNPSDIERCIQQNASTITPPNVPLDKVISTVNDQQGKINELEQLKSMLMIGIAAAIMITVLLLAKR